MALSLQKQFGGFGRLGTRKFFRPTSLPHLVLRNRIFALTDTISRMFPNHLSPNRKGWFDGLLRKIHCLNSTLMVRLVEDN